MTDVRAMLGTPQPTLSGWGRLAVPGRELVSEDLEGLTRGAVLTRGLGRAYGDAALPPPGRREVAGSRLADRILAFDAGSGLLRAEAGLSLRELNRLLLPRGWFAPVTPGTQDVSLGGMVAADVHGKNHHRAGTFGRHVQHLRLCLADGKVVECSRELEPDLFRATLGGMGLTGHILEVEVPLEPIPSPWILGESARFANLDELLGALEDSGRDWSFTATWIDCLGRGRKLGRGILFRGRWADPTEAPPSPARSRAVRDVGFVAPDWLLSRPAVAAFNRLTYGKHLPRVRRAIVDPEEFFYPLDSVGHWNRLYGPRGFTQYQCVLPAEAGRGAARRFLELLVRLGGASYLAVAKDCGPQGEGTLSFPRPGISLALDLPVGPGIQELVDRLNERLIEEGGRIYLAKDALTRREHFRAMEPRLSAFEEVRRRYDPEGRIRSALSVRLLGDRA